jgi:hypothetical protein
LAGIADRGVRALYVETAGARRSVPITDESGVFVVLWDDGPIRFVAEFHDGGSMVALDHAPPPISSRTRATSPIVTPSTAGGCRDLG